MTSTSTVKMFYIGNFADMDWDESNPSNEDPDVVLGLYDNLQFAEITQVDVDDDGVIYDDEYGTGDYLRYDTGNGETISALDNSSLYNADVLLADGSTLSVPVLVVQSAKGDVFVSEYSEYPLDDLTIKSIDLVSLNTTYAAGIYRGTSDVGDNQIECFGSGTLIDTPDGPKPIEELRPGLTVTTLDHGSQEILWMRRQEQDLAPMGDEASPILIGAGAIGWGIPSRQLVVSPQHRILVGGCGQLEQAFPSECFVPAKALTTLPGIRKVRGKRTVTWVHFACARHEIVFASGCFTESLLLGPMVMRSRSARERHHLHRLFGPTVSAQGALNGAPARECLSVGDAQRAIRRHRAGQCLTHSTSARDARSLSEPSCVPQDALGAGAGHLPAEKVS